MGQQIDVQAVVHGEMAVFDTDRGITGQDGFGFSRGDDTTGTEFAGRLASRLFEADEQIAHVFAVSNQVVIRRPDGWDESTVGSASDVIRDLLVFYDA